MILTQPLVGPKVCRSSVNHFVLGLMDMILDTNIIKQQIKQELFVFPQRPDRAHWSRSLGYSCPPLSLAADPALVFDRSRDLSKLLLKPNVMECCYQVSLRVVQ